MDSTSAMCMEKFKNKFKFAEEYITETYLLDAIR
jgi:hypothetical protein